MSGRVRRECEYCGKSFFVFPSDVESGGAKFCSRTCFANARTSRIRCTCQTCGKKFESFPSALTRGGGKYCSVECRAKAHDAHIERTCEECGSSFMARRGEVEHGRAKYCCDNCRNRAHQKRVSFACDECGKQIEVPQCRDGMRFCSFECLQRWRQEHRVARTCEKCGKTFDVRPERFEGGRGKFCSARCRKEYFKEKGPTSWYEDHTNPTEALICARCGKEFFAPRFSRRRFCSFVCRLLFRGETSIEALIRQELQKRGVEFKQEVQVGRFSVDFLLPKHYAVIECDGEYWHSSAKSKARDEYKDKFLAEKGYQVYRFTEHEIRRSASECVNRVLES